MKLTSPRSILSLGLMLASAALSEASLTSSYQFNGKGNWSIDAVGSNNTPVGSVSAYVPTGSYIEKAFLYSSMNSNLLPDLSLAGISYTGAAWTGLGTNSGLTAYRVDVTSQIRSLIGSGSNSLFNFSITENQFNDSTDGEVLAIVFSNGAESERTIAFLDGFSSSTGDSTTINFATPLNNVGNAGFEALVSLGIGYSAGPENSQFSQITAGGRVLSNSAGAYDDGQLANGALITAGGLGDNPANPNPSSDYTDDELYNLAQGNSVDPTPFLSNGLTSFTFNTLNPSEDDNIFFLGVNITAVAGVNQQPPTNSVPDSGSTAVLALVGAVALIGAKRLGKSA